MIELISQLPLALRVVLLALSLFALMVLMDKQRAKQDEQRDRARLARKQPVGGDSNLHPSSSVPSMVCRICDADVQENARLNETVERLLQNLN